MLKTNLSYGLFISCLCFVFCSCAINRKIPVKDLDASIVPADFNPQKQVLLVVQIPKRYKPAQKDEKRTQKMEDLFKKYYPYKFEIVSPEEVNADNAKYTDTTMYKYAIMNKLYGVRHTSNYTTYSSNGGQHTMSPSAVTTYLSYSFFDRINNKQYDNSYQSPYLKSAVEAFANTVKKAK